MAVPPGHPQAPRGVKVEEDEAAEAAVCPVDKDTGSHKLTSTALPTL